MSKKWEEIERAEAHAFESIVSALSPAQLTTVRKWMELAAQRWDHRDYDIPHYTDAWAAASHAMDWAASKFEDAERRS